MFENDIFKVVLVSLLALLVSAAHAEDDWLARKGGAEISRTDFEQYLVTINQEHRAGFMRSFKRVADTLDNLLLNEMMLNDALKEGVDQDPAIQAEIERARQRILVDSWMKIYSDRATMGDAEQLAYEKYLATKDNYKVPESLDISHILVKPEGRTEMEALALIEEIRQRISSDELAFEDAVMAYSEDMSKANNKGRFPMVRRGQMVKPFEDAAFALSSAGDLSAPVKTQFGYHLVVLHQKNPERQMAFEEVKESLLEAAQSQLRVKAREDYMSDLRNQEPAINETAIRAMMENYQPAVDHKHD